MKWLAMIVIGFVLLGLLAYVVLAVLSQKQPDNLGLQNGMLKPCPDSPNCVCSESHSQADTQHFIEAMTGNEQTWMTLREIMVEQGGDVQTESADYMHIIFSTAMFRYVDDVELRFDREQHLIHIRSASRMGRSDFGVNRKRVNKLKKVLENTQ